MPEIDKLKQKINGGNHPLFIELYGKDPDVLKAQSDRYGALMDQFRSTYEMDDVQLFSSPGRTEIGGNHTDHNHGRVLAGAVNLDNIAVVSKNDDNIIRIKSSGYPQFQVDLANLEIDK